MRIAEHRPSTIRSPVRTDEAASGGWLNATSFWQPEFVAASTWMEHAPFAFWLVDALKPNTFVELGTHGGFSYFCFCQAVERLGLQTRCFAIDTWLGDEHTGFYDEEVFASVERHHARYASFSRLVRTTFTEAARHFSDGSVDLLHIDGRHFYDDVKSDFETWAPKLSERSVVLFHDTNVRERDFGVFRLWEELRDRYPSFEFLHSHGLGVLGTGRILPKPVQDLLAVAEQASVLAEIRTVYAHLGGFIASEFARSKTAEELAKARKLLAECQSELREADALSSRNAVLELQLRTRPPRNFDREAVSVQPISSHDVQPSTLRREGRWHGIGRRLPEPLRRGLRLVLTKARARHKARAIRGSSYFDEAFYRARADLVGKRVDPVKHYLTEGERLGIPPSERFDPRYYAERNPDVSVTGESLLLHYLAHGSREQRSPVPQTVDWSQDAARLADKATVVLISHEATQTGAPVLSLSIARRLSAKYNVISLLLKGGELKEEFERVSAKVVRVKEGQTHPVDLKFVLQSINRQHPICQGIVNSLAAANAVPALAQTGIPSILLIHEFYAQVESLFDVSSALYWASERVFSADLVRDSYQAAFPHLRTRTLPQGACDPTARSDDGQAKFLQKLMRPRVFKDALVVLGIGTIDMRKGIDLFIATATSVVRSNPQQSFRFVWIGEPGPNKVYQAYIDEQINRSGIGDSLVFIPGGIDLEAAYSFADALYLPSRLDPLPNVAIDAAMHGLPVICFDGATGIADILKLDITAGGTVLPYLDVAGAAQKIAELARDAALRGKIGGAMRELALKTFDMDRYVRSIDEIGVGAQAAMRQLHEDFVTISENSLFDSGVTPAAKRPPAESTAATQHFPSVWERPSIARDNAIMQFLARWSAAPEGAHRRPTPGFHPQIYAEHHPKLLETGTNPFADFLRKGCPAGPWFNQVIRPELRVPAAAADLRVAIHAHFHYPELIDDFLVKLAANSSRYDLFLTTNDTAKAARLRGSIGDRGEIYIVPNKGRDIGPLLTAFGSELIDRYDVIGHLHAKRSVGVSPTLPDLGDRWREFLWQHLIGDRHPMMDLLLKHFARDEKLGLVFADDIHLCGWDADGDLADELAERAGIARPLDRYFNFPVGTMFWARSQALAPLAKLNLDWSDYPEEPVPIDGTILHALERLVPFATRQAGLGYATVNVPGVTWD